MHRSLLSPKTSVASVFGIFSLLVFNDEDSGWALRSTGYWREQFGHQARVDDQESECAGKTCRQGLLYLGLIRPMGCAISTEYLNEGGPILGAFKGCSAV